MFRVVDNFILGLTVEGSGLLSDLTSEPIIPTLEAIERLTGVAYVVIVTDTLKCFWAKPAIRSIVHVLKGKGRIKHFCIFVINGAQKVIYFS